MMGEGVTGEGEGVTDEALKEEGMISETQSTTDGKNQVIQHSHLFRRWFEDIL